MKSVGTYFVMYWVEQMWHDWPSGNTSYHQIERNLQVNCPIALIFYNRLDTILPMHLSNIMMTASNGDIFRVTGPLWRESIGQRRVPLTKASDAELWCFLWYAPEQTVKQTIETPVLWYAIALIWRHCNDGIMVSVHRGHAIECVARNVRR